MVLAGGAGIVDAISLLTLGVFTAAVTANVVLIGRAACDADMHTAVRRHSRSLDSRSGF